MQTSLSLERLVFCFICGVASLSFVDYFQLWGYYNIFNIRKKIEKEKEV
jgi:hypothetical protein